MLYIYIYIYHTYMRAMCGWLDVLRSFLLSIYYYLYIYHLPPISISIFPPFYIYYFSVCNSMDADGDRNFCSFCAFRSTFVFVSSGTDCRVRRRMHAPFPGPYVSTFLPLIIRPIVRSLSLDHDSKLPIFPYFVPFLLHAIFLLFSRDHVYSVTLSHDSFSLFFDHLKQNRLETIRVRV